MFCRIRLWRQVDTTAYSSAPVLRRLHESAMKAHLACLRCYRGFLCVLLFAAWGLVMPGLANATGRASFAVAQGTFDVNRATLEVFLLRPGKAPLLLSGGAFRQDSEVTELASDSWTISQEGNQYRVDIKVEDDRLRFDTGVPPCKLALAAPANRHSRLRHSFWRG